MKPDEKIEYKVMELRAIEPLQESFNANNISDLTGIHPELIVELEHAGFVMSESKSPAGEPMFSAQAVCRYRQIAELRNREHLSFRMIFQMLKLLNRLESVEDELKRIRES